MKSRLKQVYRLTLPIIYSVAFENRFDKTSGILYFKDKKDADYLYKIADHVQCRTSMMANVNGEIPDTTLDIYDYGLIRIDQMFRKAIYKSKVLSDILYIDNKDFNVQPIGEQSIITYIKD